MKNSSPKNKIMIFKFSPIFFFLKRKGIIIIVINFVPTERARGKRANNFLFSKNKRMPKPKKVNMNPSKCKFPVNSIITRGFKKYHKIFSSLNFNFFNILHPIKKFSISDIIINNLIEIKLNEISFLNQVDKKTKN